MSQYNMVLTAVGIELQNQIETGETLEFTRMAMGSGTLTGNAVDQTALVVEKQAAAIAAVGVDASGNATVRADFSNSGLATGYYMKELGIFVKDVDNPDEEVLYAYGYAGDLASWMPPDEGGDITTIIQEVVVTVGNATEVTATIDQSAVYVTGTQWAGHVGVGGTPQHPAATTGTAGFLSAADKAKLDGHVGVGGVTQHPNATAVTSGFMASADKAALDGHIGANGAAHAAADDTHNGFMTYNDRRVVANMARCGWAAKFKYGSGDPTPADFTDLNSHMMGIFPSRAGSLFFTSPIDIGCWLFEMQIYANGTKDIALPVLMVDKHVRIYRAWGDGTHSVLLASLNGQKTSFTELAFQIPVGFHRIQVVLTSDTDTYQALAIGEWMRVDGLLYQGVPDQWASP